MSNKQTKFYSDLNKKIEKMKDSQLSLEDVLQISKEFYSSINFEGSQAAVMKGTKAYLNTPIQHSTKKLNSRSPRQNKQKLESHPSKSTLEGQ